jgi:hypothetical protein
MIRVSLIIFLACAVAGDLSPVELIARLDSPDRVVREEAARTLVEQGALALPPLRAAHESTRKSDTRERLAELIARIESRRLDRPTLVELDVDDRPLGEAVRTLAMRSGFALALDDQALASRRVNIRTTGPLPFWDTLDRLGRAGHIRHDPGPGRDRTENDPPVAAIRLVAGEPPGFTTYSGPLRIHLFATHRHRDISFETAGAGGARVPDRKGTVTVEIQAFAEPGRFIDPGGFPSLEAVDEHGRTISERPEGAVEQPDPFEHSWLDPERISLLHWHIPLGLTEPPARPGLRLRGLLPVVISTRTSDPVIVPLRDANGKAFRQGAWVVRVEKGFHVAANNTSWNVFLDNDGSSTERTRVSPDPEQDYIGDFLRNRIEFEDAQHRPLRWVMLGNRAVSTSTGQLRVETMVAGAAPPARLLVFRLQRMATKIPFELADVPLP